MLRSHQPCISAITYPTGHKDRSIISGTKRLEPSQCRPETRRDITEKQFRIDINLRNQHFGINMLLDVIIESLGKLLHIIGLHGHTGCIHVSAEIFEQVGARLYSLVQIESRNATSRSRNKTIAHGQHDRRTIIGFDQPGSHNSYDAFHPFRIVDHRTLELLHERIALDVFVCFRRHTAINVFTILIAAINKGTVFTSHFVIASHHQRHG